MYVGEKISTKGWSMVTISNQSFIERAKDGSYIEAVEIDTSNNEVSRWGKSSITDDGI
ncbi:hypothetical protein [Clostridioides difficile]|uniref:hypothetical protein n=1 Tax=Clostridioides difficile TaxID=1496 RepID=UPI0023556DA8|nr:hypothetical protein [Clostridioides difficile]